MARPGWPTATGWRSCSSSAGAEPLRRSGVLAGLLAPLWRCAPLLLALTMLFWSGNSIAARALVGTAPPMTLAFWRWALAFSLISLIAWPHVRRDWPELKRRWRIVLALSASGVATFGALMYLGLQTTTALNSLLVQAAIPPLILLFGWIGLGERARGLQLAGVVLSIAGVLVIVTAGRPWDLVHLKLNHGDLLILIGVLLYAVYSLILRRRPDVHPLSLLWATFGLALGLLAPFYAIEAMSGRRMTLGWAALAGVGYVAVFPSFLSYLFFNRGVELIGAGRAGVFLHLQPVFGSLLAVTLLGEAFRPFHAAGVALIGAGILIASRGPKTAAA